MIIVAVGVVVIESPLQPMKTCLIITPIGDVTEKVAVDLDPESYQSSP
jgi:hypothetical protein